jgi:hypothetical protein
MRNLISISTYIMVSEYLKLKAEQDIYTHTEADVCLLMHTVSTDCKYCNI